MSYVPNQQIKHPRPHSPLVFDTRTLGRQPGTARSETRIVPAPVDLRVAMACVPSGADIKLTVLLEAVSEGVLAAARVDNRLVTGEDFETFASLHELTPTLDPRAGGLGFVKTYFSIINKVATMASDRLPGLASWCDAERTVCAKYAAVQIDMRLQLNLEMAASYSSN